MQEEFESNTAGTEEMQWIFSKSSAEQQDMSEFIGWLEYNAHWPIGKIQNIDWLIIFCVVFSLAV